MMNKEKIQKLYEYYYLYNIHTLINKYNLEWTFIDVEKEIYQYESYDKDEINNGENFIFGDNRYLRKYKDEKIKLAENILKEKGMFFPFFATKRNNKNEILLGKHRLYSLKLYIDKYKVFPQKLLCIFFSNDWREEIINDFCGELYQYDYVKDFLSKEFFSTHNAICKACDSFGHTLGLFLFDWPEIKPSRILNDEEAFLDFINNPFKIQE